MWGIAIIACDWLQPKKVLPDKVGKAAPSKRHCSDGQDLLQPGLCRSQSVFKAMTALYLHEVQTFAPQSVCVCRFRLNVVARLTGFKSL